MKKTADSIPCKVLVNSKDPKYAEEIREFQGCPSIAITRKGRIYTAWYSGGWVEPHMKNYNLVNFSDDGGKTWTQNIVVIPSDIDRWVQALDIQLWIAPDGRLFIFWVQNNTIPIGMGVKGYTIDGFVFNDSRHAQWFVTCDNPDDDEPRFSQPTCIGMGFMRCKPTVLQSGRWLLFNYDQSNDRYGYSITDDEGKTFTRRYGARKIPTPFDESMAYQRDDGTIHMLARSSVGRLAETFSTDNGETWSKARASQFLDPSSRLYVSKTSSGKVVLVNNDHAERRTNMTVFLSDDDGVTFKYKKCIDTNEHLSYPDLDFYNGKMYLVYDRERCHAREIRMAVFTEEDIMDPNVKIKPQIISKSTYTKG